MATDLPTLVKNAAAGDSNAFADLLVALHHDLRAWLAGFAINKAMVDTAEREVWTLVRKKLLAGVPEFSITKLIHQIGASVLSRMMQSVEQSTGNGTDGLSFALAKDGLERLASPQALSNSLSKKILHGLQQQSDNDRQLFDDIFKYNKSLDKIVEDQHASIDIVTTRCFEIRQRIYHDTQVSDTNSINSKLALLVGYFLDNSINPSDLQLLQNRIREQPIECTHVVQQIRTHLILNELIDPQAHATIRIFANDLMKNSMPRTRTDSSMMRAVARATQKVRRIPFVGVPPPSPITARATDATSSKTIFIIAAGLIVICIAALLLVWNTPPKKHVIPESSVPEKEQTTATDPATSQPTKVTTSPTNAAHTDDDDDRFIRGFNLGGDLVIINRKVFLGKLGAKQTGFSVNVKTSDKTSTSISSPGLTFEKKILLENGLKKSSGDIILTQKASSGAYQWWIWISDPDGLQLQDTTVTVDGKTVHLSQLISSVKSDVYGRFGPFPCEARDDELSLTVSSLGRSLLCGAEIHSAPNSNSTLPMRFNVTWPEALPTMGDTLTIPVNVGGEGISTLAITLYMNGAPVQNITKPPYVIKSPALKAGKHEFYVIFYDGEKALYQSRSKKYVVAAHKTSGAVLFDRWDDRKGTALERFNKFDLFNISPSTTETVSQISIDATDGTNYAARWRGYITPPVTGPYTFLFSSRGDGAVFLSTSNSPNDLIRIVDCLDSPRFNKTSEPTEKSKPITLEKGNSYYFEILFKPGVGSPFLRFGWELPDGTKQVPVPASVLVPCDPTLPAYQHVFKN